MLPLCALLFGAVTLELERPPDLSAEEATTLERLLMEAVGEHPAASKAEGERLRWTVDVGATRIQLLLERFEGASPRGSEARVGPRDVGAWGARAKELIEALYGPPGVEPPPLASTPVLVSERPSAPTALVALSLGASAAALVGGALLAASSLEAQGRLDSEILVQPELGALSGRATAHGALAVGLAVGALGFALVGALLLAD